MPISHLEALRVLKLTSNFHCSTKFDKIFHNLQLATNLIDLDIDLNKYPNNRELAKFISSSRLSSLKVRNYSTEDDALNSLVCLAKC